MRKSKQILAGILSAAMVISGLTCAPVTQAEADSDVTVIESKPVITELPGTDSTTSETGYNASFLSLTGFADGHVNARSQYKEGDPEYRRVTDEQQFLQALDDAGSTNAAVKVIEIAADLDLGWESLLRKYDDDGDGELEFGCISEYGWDIHGTDTYNPSIIRSGISKLNISNTNGLTIFSQAGNSVEHAEWTLQTSSKDIVIRNLTFDEMWHWSEGASSKEAGWTLMKIYAKGVWIDHCSFTLGADGCVDSENGASNVTMSWCTFSLPSDKNPSKDSMIYKTVSYMEYLYQNDLLDTSNSRYYNLRENGASVKQIMAYEAYHNKCNLNGSGDKDFKDGEGLEDGNQRLHLTMAYNKVTNIGQRFPLLRQGTMHLVNCYIDNSGHMALHGTYPFSKYGGWSSNRAINARDGATVGADNCVFNGLQAINGTEKHYEGYPNMNEGWDIPFQNAYNHPLVVNSRVVYGGKSYTGSSWDYDGNNLFIENPKSFWSDNGSTIGDFHWYSSIDNVDQYTRGVTPKDADGNVIPFTFSYSEGEENTLPYSYQKLALDDVTATVDKYAGAYVYNEDSDFWLRTEYTADETFVAAADDNQTVSATDLHMSDEEISIDKGTVWQLDADAVPSNADNKEVTWVSSDPNVAEVLDSGLVIGKEGGTATVTATLTNADGTKVVKTCKVTVTVGVASVSISVPSTSIYVGETMQLSAEVLPDDATDRSVAWSSSNKNVLSIDENGVATGLKTGNVTVTCKSVSNPSVKNTVRITVKAAAATETPDETETPEPSAAPDETETPEPSATPDETETPDQTTTPDETEEPPVKLMYGDVNDDLAVTANDALQILRIVVKLSPQPEGRIFTQADVDGDTLITANDALYVLKHVVKLITVFPAEK